MAITDQQINDAVPPAGTPNRALTNLLLRDLRNAAEQPPRQVVNAAPTDGSTVTMAQNSRDMTLVLQGPAPLNALTLALPANGVSQIGQICRVITIVAIDALTVTGATNIINPPPQLFDGDNYAFQKIEDDTWIAYA